MNLLQLEYFKIIAEAQSLTKVAEDMHISQPALSKTIKVLETELGVKLFDRDSKYIALNDNGKILLDCVNKIFQSLDDVKRELADRSVSNENYLTIFDQTCSIILPMIIKEFNFEYPAIKFHILRQQYNNDDARHRKYDLMLYDAPQNDPCGENSTQLLTEDLVIGFNKNHPLAKRTSITLSEVAKEGFISLADKANLRKTTERYCKISGFDMNTTIECFEWTTLRELVKLGLGIAFFPKYSWASPNETDIVFVKISSPHCSRSINMSWSDSGYLSKPVRLFKSFIIEYFKKYKQDDAT